MEKKAELIIFSTIDPDTEEEQSSRDVYTAGLRREGYDLKLSYMEEEVQVAMTIAPDRLMIVRKKDNAEISRMIFAEGKEFSTTYRVPDLGEFAVTLNTEAYRLTKNPEKKMTMAILEYRMVFAGADQKHKMKLILKE